MKKAVFIINSLQNGGAERVVVTQADYLQKKGVDVTVICLRRWIQYDIDPAVHVICLSDKRQFSAFDHLTGVLWLTKRLNRVLDRITGDGDVILLTSNLLYPDLVTRLSKYSKRALYVLHAHQDILSFSKRLPYKIFVRLLYRNRQIVCVGKSIADEMTNVYGMDKKMIRVVQNPVDGRTIDRMRYEKNDFPYPYILFCGRLTAVKCPERVIRAFYKGGFYKNYSLVILGIGELEDKLKQMAEKYNVAEKVCFRGWEKNVYKWMDKADLLILTSDSEGLSMVLLEALYCECPVVAVRSRGPEQIMTGELERYLCGPSDDSVIGTMKAALSHYPDHLVRYTENFSVDKNVKTYLEIYREWDETVK